MFSELPMPTEIDPCKLLTLVDHETVRFNLPPLPITGVKKPLRIHLDFDIETVGLIIERLRELHRQMKN